jgi:hypothetical protein
MTSDEIKAGHCYSMRSMNGRHVITQVTKFLDRPTGRRVLFVWRHAVYPQGWSSGQQQTLLADFALAAEEEIACS